MIRRRIALIYWVAAISLFMPGAAYAYIDPATTTYLIQIATALVVTIGVSLSIFLYRFKMISTKIKYRVYGLIYRSRAKDEQGPGSAVKDREPYTLPEYAIPGDVSPPALDSFNVEVRDELAAEKAAGSPKGFFAGTTIPETYKGKLSLVIPLALALGFSFIVVGCLELTIQYASEIPFSVSRIMPVVFFCFAAFSAVLILVVSLFRGKAYEFLIAVGLAVLTAGYIQGNFLNQGLGELTGDAVIWGDLTPQIAASLVCWVGSFILVFLIWRRARGVWRRLIVIVPFLVILLQGVGFISVVNENANAGRWGTGYYWQTVDEALTIDRVNEVASENNAIIIVLDRLDQEFIEEIAAEDPHFFDPLDGFTEFDDYISWFGSTFPSVAAILTGHRYMYDIPRSDYYDFAWANAEFLLALRETGIDVRLYLDRGAAFDSTNQLGGIASNTFEGRLGINKRIAIVKLLKLSGYRYAPVFLKQFFWLSPYEFNDTIILTDKTAPFMVSNFGFYDGLIQNRLSVSEDISEAFLYLHLQGSHPPLNMDENIRLVEESTLLRQTMGAYRIVYEYLDQLKALGLYESSTIVIMGDHGNFLGNDLTRPARTGLMVKPAGSFGTPMDISHAPVSPAQLHATLMEGLRGDSRDFGDTFFDIKEGDDVVREYIMNLWHYEIKGDGRDFKNWRLIGLFPDTYR